MSEQMRCDGCGYLFGPMGYRSARGTDGVDYRVCPSSIVACLELAVGKRSPDRDWSPATMPAEPAPMSEDDLHNRILAFNGGLPEGMRWEIYHTHDSRHSPKGWPDLVLAREPNELLIRELKSSTGTVSREQRWWLRVLGAMGLDCAVWRPCHLAEIEARLVERRPSAVAVANVSLRTWTWLWRMGEAREWPAEVLLGFDRHLSAVGGERDGERV